jgi:hypothetical protein
MNKEVQMKIKKRSRHGLRYSPNISPEGTRKTTQMSTRITCIEIEILARLP